MHPLTLLAAALGWNWCRDRRGRSTICSVTRPHVTPETAVVGWLILTAWFLPHYVKPMLASKLPDNGEANRTPDVRAGLSRAGGVR